MERATDPACPRCGYDLGGVITAWNGSGKERSEGASCPLEGVCSECGYGFLWRDLMSPRYRHLPAFCEHAIGFRGRLWARFITLLWLALPKRFWQRVHLHHDVRIWRSRRFAIEAVVAAVVLLVLFQVASGMWSSHRVTGRGPRGLQSVVDGWCNCANVTYAITRTGTLYGVAILEANSRVPRLAAFAGFFGAWLLLIRFAVPVTLRREGVQRRHIQRACAYSALCVAWLAVLGALTALAHAALTNRLHFHSAYAHDYGWVSVGLASLWLSQWWLRTLTVGWCVPQGVRVWAALLCVAVLTGIVAYVVTFWLVLTPDDMLFLPPWNSWR